MARKRSKHGTEKHLHLECKQCARDLEPKVDGMVEKGPSLSVQKYVDSGKDEKGANRAGERDSGPNIGGKKGGKGQEKGDARAAWSCEKTGHIAANGTKESCTRSLNVAEEDEGDISEEVHEDEDELHAWCFLKESENEQWQEVISKKSKWKLKKFCPCVTALC